MADKKTPDISPAAALAAATVMADLSEGEKAALMEITGEAPAHEVLTLKRVHTHDGVEYPVGHEFTAEEWGLTEKQVGWLQAVETI